MNKLKMFLENFLIYGLGGVIGKIIPLIMVPIVTRFMPNTDYYGLSDMSNTVVSFASALAIMGMYDAMYRMFFEHDDEAYKKTVCSTALSFTVMSSLAVFVLMLLAKNIIAQCFFANLRYAYLVYLTALTVLTSATNSIVSAPTRMLNKRKVYLVTNFMTPLISYTIAIILLMRGHYVIALPLANMVSGFVMEGIFFWMNHSWFSMYRIDWSLLKPLLWIAIPALPTFLIYWVFNSSDRLMITNLIGIGASGIYSVGSKLGHASQLIYTAFAGGWQFFAFSTMKEKNQVKTNSMVFEYLGLLSFIATTFVCAWSHRIFELLFEAEYIEGYVVAPYLFLAPLLQMLFQVAGNQFLIVKNTVPSTFTLMCGAFLNVGLNLFLIPRIGIEGAAIATLMGYIVSVISCVVVLMRMKLFVLSRRFVEMALLMTGYILVWRLFLRENVMIGTIFAISMSATLLWLYRKDIQILLGDLHRAHKFGEGESQ